MTSLRETLDMLPGDSAQKGLWVFAYGSLLWRPNFDHTEIRDATLRGYHRGLCIYSHQYRGTPEVPGLVFGLDRGGLCRGRILRVAPKDIEDVVSNLYEREMITRVYLPRMVNVTTNEGSRQAFTFIADRSHYQYAGKLSDDETVRLIMQGCGKGGPCLEYVENTVEHLQAIGIRDGYLEKLLSLTDGQHPEFRGDC